VLRIWLPIIISGTFYLLGSIWFIVAWRRAGQKVPVLMKLGIGLSGAALIWWIWEAVVATIHLR
jgi:hypothetical protein